MPGLPIMLLLSLGAFNHTYVEGIVETNRTLDANMTTDDLPRPEAHILKKVLDPKTMMTMTTTLGIDKFTDWMFGSGTKGMDTMTTIMYFLAGLMTTIGLAIAGAIIWCMRKERAMKKRAGRRDQYREV